MKYFKIIWGYDEEDMLPIDETELDKAMQCFIQKRDGVFKSGPIKGDRVITVQEDWHRAMGWNRGYKLGPEDYAEIGPQKRREYQNALEEAKYTANQQLGSGVEQKKLNS